MRLAALVPSLLATLLAACSGSMGPSSPASDGVRAYVAALRSKDPHDAYKLLDSATKRRVSYDEFELQWKQSEKERDWQIRVLEDSLKGNPDVGERASIGFADGKVVQLEREGKVWRLESELVSRTRAKEPRDAIRLFADAISGRDAKGALDMLTKRRRDGLAQQVGGFVLGLTKHVNEHIELFGADRAELRWDENGVRYRVVLKREEGEWRVDDLYIRAAPKDESSEGGVEGVLPDEL